VVEAEVEVESRIWIGRAAWPHRRLRKAPNKEGSVSGLKLSSAEQKPKIQDDSERAGHRTVASSKEENWKIERRGRRGGLRGESDEKSNDRKTTTQVRHARGRAKLFSNRAFTWFYSLLRQLGRKRRRGALELG
jgi:hypothetical protein